MNQTKSKRGGARAGAGRKSIESQVKQAVKALATVFPGADPYQPGRTFIYSPTPDSTRELTPYVRTELMKKARWLYNAFGLPRRAIDGPAVNACGAGISPSPMTSNDDFNEAAMAKFEEGPGCDARFFDAAARVNYYDACPMILKQVGLDGDFFAQPLRATDGTGRVRFIEGTHVGNSNKFATNFKEDQWRDGVRSDAYGRPIAYRVLSDPFGSNYTDVPASDMWHVARRERAGYVRGASWLATAVTHLHDLSDIFGFTKQSFKMASQMAFIVSSDREIGMGASRTGGNTAGDNPSVTLDKLTSTSGYVQLKPGEKIETVRNPHPGDAFDPFVRVLCRDIAWSVGVSPDVLWDISTVGGAPSRYMIAEAQRLYESMQDMLIEQFCRPFWRYWLWHEIEAGNLKNAPADWWKVEFIRPANITVDFGRDGKLLADLVDRGLLNSDRWHAMYGRHGAHEDRMALRIAARRKAMAAEEGVEPGEVFRSNIKAEIPTVQLAPSE